MTEPAWLLRTAIVAVHGQMIAEFGGSSGIRDEGLLESALARPVNQFNYESADLFELAALYASGVVRNHPFVDGNKRTAFIAAYVFLQRNGFRLAADEASATAMTVALAASEVDAAAYADWLRKNGEYAT